MVEAAHKPRGPRQGSSVPCTPAADPRVRMDARDKTRRSRVRAHYFVRPDGYVAWLNLKADLSDCGDNSLASACRSLKRPLKLDRPGRAIAERTPVTLTLKGGLEIKTRLG